VFPFVLCRSLRIARALSPRLIQHGGRNPMRRFGFSGGGRHELTNGDDELANRVIVAGNGSFEFRQLGRQLCVGERQVTQFYKRTDDKYADFNGAGRIQYRGSHDGAVFGEGVGKVLAMSATSGL
jgi:hypothetical protein